MQDAVWWKRGVVYQVYPRSFQDSNGDGVGDLAGIKERLPYLQWLGVDAVWISPIYPSPMKDFGYDVADYCAIDPRFGTLDDFDALVAEAHRLGLKLILDFVPNHTSDQHAWFKESRSSRDNPKRDWYIWRDAKPDGSPPNNWISNFGGSAWTWDEATGQYYYHAFLTQQPDLNWRNPAVREAMYGALDFWMKRGVDGFRVDVIWHLIKDAELRDNPPNPAYMPGQSEINRLLQIHSADQPEVLDVIAGMREVLDRYPDRVLIGEIYLPFERLVAYYGHNLNGAQLPFNFALIQAPWNATTVSALVQEYEAHIPEGGWPNWVLGNHDQHRICSRIGVDQTRVAAMMLLTLRGTPTMYYGDEIGMCDVPIPHDAVQDPWEVNEPGMGFGRDPERTPMQWSQAPNAGFTTGRPWLPVGGDAAHVNVDTLKDDDSSTLTLYRRLLELRRQHPALSLGSFKPLVQDKDVFSYERQEGGETFRVFLNMGRQPHDVTLDSAKSGGRVVLSTIGGRVGETTSATVSLRASEGLLVQC